ncbi:hypothetical protein SAMN04489761_3394 [Tenacibaculum sp. MAR_2009_124]|uniref:hypothetical protein n=1 Tax=Tenacibaculum sp. MAR_2009_124 TaxID=1250059 RepID=UPI000899B59C|nr:hypothetical protein [Tenacibaculum sp. MAR_2009_124]SEC64915.1 hypothetical protein SAMN04489761_3394 [Tenacibaculum sp. MAR_2009_124]
MGWTSYTYTESTHKTFNANNAYTFCINQYNKENYNLIKFYFQKASFEEDNHVVYLVMKHKEGYNFIMLVLISIYNKEIFYKEVTASMGPLEDRCPVSFLSMVPMSKTGSLEYDWFIKVLKNKIKYKNQIKQVHRY